jgi:hypothetical protein
MSARKSLANEPNHAGTDNHDVGIKKTNGTAFAMRVGNDNEGERK